MDYAILKILVILLYYKACIICSLDLMHKENLNIFNNEHLIALQNFFDELNPFYCLFTYIIDPFDEKIIYLFIEHLSSNIIKHHTINLNYLSSLKDLKIQLLNNTENLNHIFRNCINSQLLLTDEIIELNNFEKCKPLNDFFEGINFILNKFRFLICNIDYKYFEFNDIASVKLKKNYFKEFILLKCDIEVFIVFCKDLRYHNFIIISYEFNYMDYELNIKRIEYHMFSKIEFFKDLKMQTRFEKIKRINYFASNLNRFCSRYKISLDHLNKYLIFNLKRVEHKIVQYTLLLAFFHVYRYINVIKNRNMIIKLIIFCWLYFNIIKKEFNCRDSLSILFIITRHNRFYEFSEYIIQTLSVINQPKSKIIKIILIKRYLYYFLNCDKASYTTIIPLLEDEDYFNIIWLIIRCCILTQYKIFKINF